jgi:hypothetical protein
MLRQALAHTCMPRTRPPAREGGARCGRTWCTVQAVTDVTGTAVAGALGLGGTGRSEPCAPGGTAYSLDSGAYMFQVCRAPVATVLFC